MNPRALKNNAELLEYLRYLAGFLKKQKYSTHAVTVEHAICFASGSSSEFLHETMVALEKVEKDLIKAIPVGEVHDLKSVLDQIRKAFARIGGA